MNDLLVWRGRPWCVETSEIIKGLEILCTAGKVQIGLVHLVGNEPHF